MKQTLAMLFVTALLLFSLAGCGEKKDSNTANGPSTGTTDNGAAGADSGGAERAVRAQSGMVPEAGGRGVYSGRHDADCQPRLGCADTTAAHLQPPRGRAGALRSGRVSSTGKNHQFFAKMSCVFFNSQV